ncbi:MAG: ATP-binding cassette domain-containing protein [Dehalococcoidia bacterium]
MTEFRNTNGPGPNEREVSVVVENVSKSYGDLQALDDVSLEVPAGTVLGLLGPNGAGKTTLVRILTTLLKPSSGRATVAGFDVVKDATKLRSIIGLAGQSAAVDENLTGRENLVMVGRLYHLRGAEARRRADELLERFALTESAGRQSKTYSGGMRRRLDLAASLVATPRVLFLDEPTTGLDPRSRIDLWEVIRDLVRDGTTVLLTTQYLEEADQLADKITVIDHGRIIAEGAAADLKRRAGSEFLSIQVSNVNHAAAVAEAVAKLGRGVPQVDVDTGVVTMPVSGGPSVLIEAVRVVDAAEIPISDISLRQPTLDDVFLALTGRPAEDETAEPDVETVTAR